MLSYINGLKKVGLEMTECRIKLCLIFGWISTCLPAGYKILNRGKENPVVEPAPTNCELETEDLKKSSNVKWGKYLEILNICVSTGLLLIYGSFTFTMLLYNPMKVLAQSENLSGQIVYLTMFFPKTIADIVIRIATCFFYKNILQLAHDVLDLQESLVEVRSSDDEGKRISNGPLSSLEEVSRIRNVDYDYGRKNWFLTLATIITMILSALGDLLVSVNLIWGGVEFSKSFTMYLAPQSELGMRIYFQILDMMPVLSLPFALLFLVTFGNQLVGLHGLCLDKLSHLMLMRKKEEDFIKCLTFYHDEMGEAKKLLARDIVELKNCFEEYGKIAGILVVALTFNSVFSIIGSFSSVVLFQKDGNLLDTFGDILVILVVARFGNFVSKTIDKHREDCRNESSCGQIMAGCKQQADPMLDWALNWRWHLSACDVFTVDHDLIPAVVATLLTYFIFLFQLKTSESSK